MFLKSLNAHRDFTPRLFGSLNAIIPMRTYVSIAFKPRDGREWEQAWSPVSNKMLFILLRRAFLMSRFSGLFQKNYE
jgi:hypothetical protein